LGDRSIADTETVTDGEGCAELAARSVTRTAISTPTDMGMERYGFVTVRGPAEGGSISIRLIQFISALGAGTSPGTHPEGGTQLGET
jgi:hypothetical protein